jgi:peptide/nickel transport system substrate-binding protein
MQRQKDGYWARAARGRWSRRKLLRTAGVAAGGLGAAALVGCGGDDAAPAAPGAGATRVPSGSGASAGDPVAGGTLVAPGSDGGIFDPAIAIHGGTASTVFSVYDFLTYMDSGFEVTSAMAELPEIVDDTTLVYAIKPDVHWHDTPPLNGRRFTAEDAAFGLQRFGFDNPEFVFRDRYSAVDQFEVVDEFTLRLRLNEPFAPITKAVSEESALMVSREVVEEFGDAALSSDFDKQIGTGPMMPLRRTSESETVFQRNPNWRRSPEPYFDEYRAVWFADAALRQAAFVAGDTDFLNAYWIGSLAEAEDVEPQVGADNMVKLAHHVSFGTTAHFNTKVAPFSDKRIRTALHLATDRHALNAFFQGGGVIGGPIAPVIAPYGWTEEELVKLPGYRQGAEREEDLAEARLLLDAAGWDTSQSVRIQTRTASVDATQIMQQNFAEIAFKVEIDELTTGDALATRGSRQGFNLMILGQQGASDPDLMFNDYHTKGAQNYGDFSDPEIDAQLEAGRRTYDVNERKEIYDRVQTRLLEEFNPRIHFMWSRPTVTHRSYVKGWRSTPPITSVNLVMAGAWFEGKPSR